MGFSAAGTRLMNSAIIGSVFLRRSDIIAADGMTICMPPSVSRLLLSASAFSEDAQKSGSSFLARSTITFWLAGGIFFQVSLLMVTIWLDHAWLVWWKNFRNSQNLPSTPDTDEVDTPETAPDDNAAMVSPHGIRAGAMPMALHISCAFLSGTRILMFFSASSDSAFTLRCRYWVGHGTM